MIYAIGVLIFCLVFSTFSIYGLVGAITGKFRLNTSKTGPIKLYKGKAALIWGVLFFLGFGIVPGFFLLVTIKEFGIDYALLTFSTMTLLSYFLAILLRKYGAYKV